MSLETFGSRLREVRTLKLDYFGRPLSQLKASQIFNVSLSAYCNWENGRHLPDERSREKMAEIWPEVFRR